jgi:hypothetical protein
MIGRIATADEITAQLKDGIPSGESINGIGGTNDTTVSGFETCNDTIGTNCYCQTPSTLEPTSRTDIMVNSLPASTCCMTVPSHTCSQVSVVCASYIKKLSLFPQRH